MFCLVLELREPSVDGRFCHESIVLGKPGVCLQGRIRTFTAHSLTSKVAEHYWNAAECASHKISKKQGLILLQ
jgi:hypothetical protein